MIMAARKFEIAPLSVNRFESSVDIFSSLCRVSLKFSQSARISGAERIERCLDKLLSFFLCYVQRRSFIIRPRFSQTNFLCDKIIPGDLRDARPILKML
jgi:hypothetical protein